MPNLFLSRQTPLHTCTQESCENCEIKDKVVCHFSLGRLLRFLVSVMPFAVVGIVFFAQYSPWLIAAWAALFVAYFGFIEINVMCAHCPHYAEPSLSSLKCWANYGMPKLWKFKPRPMSRTEKAVFIAGFAAVFLFPVPFIISAHRLILLGIYMLLSAVSAVLLLSGFCSRCINFACPLNRVSDDVRKAFFEKNPIYKESWLKTQ